MDRKTIVTLARTELSLPEGLANPRLVDLTRGMVFSAGCLEAANTYTHASCGMAFIVESMFPGHKDMLQALRELSLQDFEMGLPFSASMIISERTGLPGDGFNIVAGLLYKRLTPGFCFHDAQSFWWSQRTAWVSYCKDRVANAKKTQRNNALAGLAAAAAKRVLPKNI